MFDDAALFCERASPYLEADPFSSSVIAVHASAVATGMRPQRPDDVWATVEEDGKVIGLAMHTPPHKLFLARMPAAAAVALAGSLAQLDRSLPGASGERAAVAAFASNWAERSGCPSELEVAMRMYRLNRLLRPSGIPGRPRRAGAADVELLCSWLAAFHDEVQPHAPSEDWAESAARRVAAGQFQIWEREGEALSLAAFSHPAAGVSRIGPVYTPPRARGHGFASAVTAHATAAALAAGARHAVLYTDLANRTSNAIYRAIGYEVDHDAEERRFVPNIRPAAG